MKLHAFPGMGADQRMFPSPWTDLDGFLAHDWCSFAGETSIKEFCRNIIAVAKIKNGDSLIGTSLGGIIACEIANQCSINHLFLVGSATHPREINRVLSLMHPIAKITPVELLKLSSAKLPFTLSQMFTDTDPVFIRTMSSAIFDWSGLAVTGGTRVHRIHGKKDLVIPAPAQTDIILNGGHLISLTHATECVDFVRSRLLKLL